MRKPSEKFCQLIKTLTGENPKFHSESFNLHYTTSNTFIKVSRPWANEWRSQNEVTTALNMHSRGVPVALPLRNEVVPFVTDNGEKVNVSIWERLHPKGSLTEEQWMMTGADWILKLSTMTPPYGARAFGFHSFLESARTRLRGCESYPHAIRVLSALDRIETSPLAKSEPRLGFIHGDVHPGNMMLTENGVKLFDWESARIGPVEWDAAQNLRHAPESSHDDQVDWWVDQGCDRKYLKFYEDVRSLTNLSFLIVTEQHGEAYQRTLRKLGWGESSVVNSLPSS